MNGCLRVCAASKMCATQWPFFYTVWPVGHFCAAKYLEQIRRQLIDQDEPQFNTVFHELILVTFLEMIPCSMWKLSIGCKKWVPSLRGAYAINTKSCQSKTLILVIWRHGSIAQGNIHIIEIKMWLKTCFITWRNMKVASMNDWHVMSNSVCYNLSSHFL